MSPRVGWLACLFVTLIMPAACTSVRPLAKIGLIAPFEGLYRQQGYEALAAMRSALTECSLSAGVDVLPLALDDSTDPATARRAMEKLLIDPAVKATIGPLTPAIAGSIAPITATNTSLWIVPTMISQAGTFADPARGTAWATGLLEAIAASARSQGAKRLMIVGLSSAWPQLAAIQPGQYAGLPVTYISEAGQALTVVETGDTVLWLGSPAEGARFFGSLRYSQPSVPFWMGPQGGDPVFAGRAAVAGPIYRATWSDDGYQPWATSHSPVDSGRISSLSSDLRCAGKDYESITKHTGAVASTALSARPGWR